jgi:hypothetical protein
LEPSTEHSGNWKKSTASGGTNCVEVNALGEHILMRDSKNPAAILKVTRAEWLMFLNAVKSGLFQ